jgi:hypothetical protein
MDYEQLELPLDYEEDYCHLCEGPCTNEDECDEDLEDCE